MQSSRTSYISQNLPANSNGLLLIIVVLLLVVFGGFSVYFLQTLSTKNAQLEEANVRINKESVLAESLREELRRAKESVDVTPTDPELSCADCNRDLPVVVFIPGGLFSDLERASLREKLVNPYFDFNNTDSKVTKVAMLIEKYEPLPAHGYRYNVEILGKGSIYEGFLFGQSSPIEWWKPECLGGCVFTDEYKVKYPNVVN